METCLPKINERLNLLIDLFHVNFKLLMKAIVLVRSKIDSSSRGVPLSPLEVAKSMHSSGIPTTCRLEGKTMYGFVGCGCENLPFIFKWLIMAT